MVPVRGAAPLLKASKAMVLLLDDTGMVSVAGFEPATSCLPDRHAYQAALHTDGGVYRIRTCDLLPARQMLFQLS